MLQIAAVGLICAVLSLAVRSYRPEFSVYISIACGLLLFAMIITQLEDVISYLSPAAGQCGKRRSLFSGSAEGPGNRLYHGFFSSGLPRCRRKRHRIEGGDGRKDTDFLCGSPGLYLADQNAGDAAEHMRKGRGKEEKRGEGNR